MVHIAGASNQPRVVDAKLSSTSRVDVNKSPSEAVASLNEPSRASAVSDGTTISSFAARLSKAASSITESTNGMDYKALHAKAEQNIHSIPYPFEGAQKAAMAKQLPAPGDAVSSQSASAATSYLEGKGSNPFAGLSREQLSTITNDDSGSFTVNERRAAYRQGHGEEEAWRAQVIAKAVKEYEGSGKLTQFFKDSLAHFMELPKMEQAHYKENYASDLQDKIKLDFNYFTNASGNGAATPGSLATLNTNGSSSHIADLLTFPD